MDFGGQKVSLHFSLDLEKFDGQLGALRCEHNPIPLWEKSFIRMFWIVCLFNLSDCVTKTENHLKYSRSITLNTDRILMYFPTI